MCFENHMFYAWYDKHVFCHPPPPRKALYLYITTHALNELFSKRKLNARSGKHMFYKTHILRTFLDDRKTCMNERTLNMRYSIHAFTMC